jgi:hypothetical protein
LSVTALPFLQRYRLSRDIPVSLAKALIPTPARSMVSKIFFVASDIVGLLKKKEAGALASS